MPNGIANSEVAALRELYPFLEVVHLRRARSDMKSAPGSGYGSVRAGDSSPLRS